MGHFEAGERERRGRGEKEGEKEKSERKRYLRDGEKHPTLPK